MASSAAASAPPPIPAAVPIVVKTAWTVPVLGTVLGGRWHLVELHDLDSFPSSWRNYVTDILACAWTTDPVDWAPTAGVAAWMRKGMERIPGLTSPGAAIAEIVDDALQRARQTTVVDLCSGGSGPIVKLERELRRRRRQRAPRGSKNLTGEADGDVRFVLTDLHPNLPAFERVARTHPSITYRREPVNALACTVPGLRTLFGSFHHFSPTYARAILQDAVNTNQGIVVVEMTGRSIGLIVVILVVTVAIALLAAPFLRPFSLRRLVFTYLIPVVPFVLCVDGFVSCLRTYSVPECKALIRSVKNAHRFHWTVSTRTIGLPFVYMTSIVGVPAAEASRD